MVRKQCRYHFLLGSADEWCYLETSVSCFRGKRNTFCCALVSVRRATRGSSSLVMYRHCVKRINLNITRRVRVASWGVSGRRAAVVFVDTGGAAAGRRGAPSAGAAARPNAVRSLFEELSALFC